MLREELVFGPIHSRRLGSSLGVNLLPIGGKLCNFDCIYCECGLNRDGILPPGAEFPTRDELGKALGERMESCLSEGIGIDSVTFSGVGEPTLHPDFAGMVDVAIEMRDRYFPSSKVSVLSNATRIDRKGVFEALGRVDNPILKLDAPTDELAGMINSPKCEYHVADIVDGMKRFEGNFILQTMFLVAPGFDSSSPEVLLPWMDIVREVRPRLVQVYTIDREVPTAGLRKIAPPQMRSLVEPLLKEGFNIEING